MKIGLYFGSFNPIHNGHLIIANHMVNYKLVDEIWLVVSPQNPFKQENQLLNANHRIELVKLAVEKTQKIKASNVEFNLPKPSYTIHTLTYLKEKYPQHEFFIVMGSDGFLNIDKWKNAQLIISDYNFFIYERPGFPVAERKDIRYLVVDAPQLLISSTHIREEIKKNHSIQFLVPDVVAESIQFNHYYSEKPAHNKTKQNN